MTDMMKEEDNQTPVSEKFTYALPHLYCLGWSASRTLTSKSLTNTLLGIYPCRLFALGLTLMTNTLPQVIKLSHL